MQQDFTRPKHLARTAGRVLIDDMTEESIREVNPLDTTLASCARDEFDNMVPSDLNSDTRRFQTRNTH